MMFTLRILEFVNSRSCRTTFGMPFSFSINALKYCLTLLDYYTGTYLLHISSTYCKFCFAVIRKTIQIYHVLQTSKYNKYYINNLCGSCHVNVKNIILEWIVIVQFRPYTFTRKIIFFF